MRSCMAPARAWAGGTVSNTEDSTARCLGLAYSACTAAMIPLPDPSGMTLMRSRACVHKY
eukprot:1160468-Pelagomonas_calceolata.AAC.7